MYKCFSNVTIFHKKQVPSQLIDGFQKENQFELPINFEMVMLFVTLGMYLCKLYAGGIDKQLWPFLNCVGEKN